MSFGSASQPTLAVAPKLLEAKADTTTKETTAKMIARIYKPAKTAMQSGEARTKSWVLDYEPEQARRVEPLMGWTSSSDMRQQVRLRFASKEDAVAYCEKHAIPYQVSEPHTKAPKKMAYADNFSFRRMGQWTH